MMTQTRHCLYSSGTLRGRIKEAVRLAWCKDGDNEPVEREEAVAESEKGAALQQEAPRPER
ncbi:MAG: hypothetical protein AAFP79_07820 [Pseudomonadota bacterium]